MHYVVDAPIAQLDRASDYGSEGCGFDLCWARQSTEYSVLFFVLSLNQATSVQIQALAVAKSLEFE